jgi:hypothetical protein
VEGVDGAIARQPYGKHVSAAMDETIEELLEAAFSVLSLQKLYMQVTNLPL